MSHRATVLTSLCLVLATQLACKKSGNSAAEDDPARTVSASASVSAEASAAAPEPKPAKSVWLEEHGKTKTRFGLSVPGGGKIQSKRGGFQFSTGWQVEAIYPTGSKEDLILGFETLAKQEGAVLIPDENPIGKAWKVIFKDKPYKAFVVKRYNKDECVLSIKSQ